MGAVFMLHVGKKTAQAGREVAFGELFRARRVVLCTPFSAQKHQEKAMESLKLWKARAEKSSEAVHDFSYYDTRSFFSIDFCSEEDRTTRARLPGTAENGPAGKLRPLRELPA